MLELQASAGMYTRIDGAYSRVPVGRLKIGLIAQEHKPKLTNDVMNDPRINNKEWVKQEGMVAFAGYPLIVEDQLVGVMAMFARQPLTAEIIDALGSVADSIALAIERKRAEAQIRKLSRVVEQSPNIIVITDIKGGIEYVNPKFTQVTGYSLEETLGQSPRILKTCETPQETYRQLWKTITSGQEWRGEFCNMKKNGELFWESAFILPIKNDEGDIIHFVAIKEDITERRKMEKELIKVQKLESVGIFAGGIAHDFNNSLQAILGYITLAELHTSSNNGIQEYLKEARKAVLQSSGLTQQLLTFSKGGTPIKNTLSISELIRDSVRLALSGSSLKCEFYLSDGLWLVDADRGQLNQVISNLIINAVQAMPEGGKIKVLAENINVTEGDSLPLQEGRYVKITVEDRGTGISQKHLQKIFDPYFTTKQKGNGLGLATTYSIIKKHDGHITVESEIEIGTTFHIYLPASQKEIQKEPVVRDGGEVDNKSLEKKGAGTPAISKGKILIMDDVYVIRVMLSKQLLSQTTGLENGFPGFF